MAITPLPTPPSRSVPSTFSALADAFLGALPTFVTEANDTAEAMNLNDTTSTSTTSLLIEVASKSLTVDVSKSYQPGMSVKIARTAAPSNWMHGDVTTYNAGTGALVVNVMSILGSGTFTDWTVTFSAPTGMPTATAESDFVVAGASPFTWLKKTLLEVKALIGLVPLATGFTIAGGTTSKTLTVDADFTTSTGGGFASGTKMLFYADTAPPGWTIQNTLDDKVVFVTKGSVAGGQTGGGAHSAGTWTQPGHQHAHAAFTLTANEIPAHTHDQHNHATTVGNSGGTDTGVKSGTYASGSTGGGASHTHPNAAAAATANTWRPAAYAMIICSKN